MTMSRRSALALMGMGAAHVLAACSKNEAADEPTTEAPEEATEEQAKQSTAAPAIASLERPMLLASLASVANDTTPTVSLTADQCSLESVSNLGDWYLSEGMRQLMDQNLFVVSQGGSFEFYEVYEDNRYALLPSFVTVDAMMHTYHLYFSKLLKTTERTSLADAVLRLAQLLQTTSQDQLQQAVGTPWESAARRNLAYFTVPCVLFDSEASIPDEVYDLVDQELHSIYLAQGVADSPLMGAQLDYSQFQPRGYYEGDERLERYFRAMMWYGQVNFAQDDEDLDRSAALMTVALEGEALSTWESVYAVTSFFAGASDDNGYPEYRPIVDEAYGQGATTSDLLSNEEAWARFHELTAQAKAPKINSLPTPDEGTDADKLAEGRGFRLMGQRFSLDAAIMQQLVYSNVGDDANGGRRMLPDALDVPAALGSDEALSILEERGATGYAGYSDNMSRLRTGIEQAGDILWTASLYSQWLHTLGPLLDEKGAGYPPFMQNQAWTRKDLLTYLGSYAELKHDTVLYAKQVMAEMGGDDIPDRDDRGYVEPEPVVLGRLAALTRATAEGLAGYGMLGDEDADNLSLLSQLADQLATIASKELTNETPTDEEFELIRSFGGQLEHFWQEVYKDEADDPYFSTREFPAAVVTDIATDPNGTCLELGTGRAASIYVIVPVDGVPRIARGAVYTFYQFPWPLSDRLTDTAWREMLDSSWGGDGEIGTGTGIYPEDWTGSFTAPSEY